MKCFYSGADAVGLCKSCGRGLSLAAATEFSKGLACKNRCEADVQRWILLIEVNDKLADAAAATLRSQRVTTTVSAAFSILAGIGFISFTGFDRGLSLPNFMGGAFILYGAYALIRAAQLRRHQRRETPNRDLPL